MVSPIQDQQLVKMTFPRTEFDLISLARTFRYIDYLWADSVQVMLAVAGVGYIPPRTRINRPPISKVNLSSPLWMEVLLSGGVGGGMTTAWWFFRYAVQNPNAIGSWWIDVKLGRERAQGELDQLREDNRHQLDGQQGAVDEALRLGSSIALHRGVSDAVNDPASNDELRYALAPPEVPTALAPSHETGRPQREISEPVEGDADSIVNRYGRDARSLVGNAGIPDIEDLQP